MVFITQGSSPQKQAYPANQFPGAPRDWLSGKGPQQLRECLTLKHGDEAAGQEVNPPCTDRQDKITKAQPTLIRGSGPSC